MRNQRKRFVMDPTKIIYGRTPELAAMLAGVKRAMAITAALNRLTRHFIPPVDAKSASGATSS
jgi:hypothetical protein